MKPRRRARPETPKWRNPIDDPATFERIDVLLGTLSRDPIRLARYERTAPNDERDLICLYAAKGRPRTAGSGIRHVVACLLSLSWQYPEEYGPAAPPHVRREKQIRWLLGEKERTGNQVTAAPASLDRVAPPPTSEGGGKA